MAYKKRKAKKLYFYLSPKGHKVTSRIKLLPTDTVTFNKYKVTKVKRRGRTIYKTR